MNKKIKEPEGRYITDPFLLSLIDSGKLDKLFAYLKDNKNKYNLTVRNNGFTLYSFGRGLDIGKSYKNLVIRFNINNADFLLKFDRDKLNGIILSLQKKYGIDKDKYEEWARKRYDYVIKTKDEKILYNLENDKAPGYDIKIVIPENDVKKFSFKNLLDTIFPIFESYSVVRPEEKFRQECMGYYSTFSRDIVVYDVEYKVNFEHPRSETKKREKNLCQENGAGIRQFFKPDLVALKKEGNKYVPLFVELKVNCEASSGDKANIGDHIVDWQNYCSFYRRSAYERENFKRAVIYTLKLMSKKGLIDCDDIEEILKNVDFNNPPQILVACGLIEESPMKLINSIRQMIDKKYKDIWKTWDTEIVVGKNDPAILLKSGEKFNAFLTRRDRLFEEGKEHLKKELRECARYMYIEDIPPRVQKRLDEELELLDKENIYDTFKVITTLTKRIEFHEYPVIYDGFKSDTLIAWLLGLTEIDPTDYNFKGRADKTARIFIPLELRQDIVEYARACYRESLRIERDDEYSSGIEEVYHLTFDFIKTPIDLVIPKFPYQTVIYDMSYKIEDGTLYTFDNRTALEYLQDEYEIKNVESVIRRLLKQDLPFMGEFHSQKTKVDMLYKLTVYSLLYTTDYYETVLKYALSKYPDIDLLIENLENSNIDKTDTTERILYEMYGDGFRLQNEFDMMDNVVLCCEDYKKEIDITYMQDLFPYTEKEYK